MPANIKLFRDILSVASLAWIACIIIGHDAQVEVIAKAVGMDSDFGAASRYIYITMGTVTALVILMVYGISAHGNNTVRYIYVYTCIAGLVIHTASMPSLAILYKMAPFVATLQMLTFVLMLIGAAIITAADTGDWFTVPPQCRACRADLAARFLAGEDILWKSAPSARMMSTERRRVARVPCRVPVLQLMDDRTYAGVAVDMSESGALVRLEGDAYVETGQPLVLEITGVGAIKGRAVGYSPRGVGILFDQNDSNIKIRLRRSVQQMFAINRPYVDLAQRTAAKVQEAFEQAVARGEI